MNHFRFFNKQDVLALTRIRRYETKLGEKLRVISDQLHLLESLNASPAKYILFGIPEDIGVMANGGRPGTDTAWPAFLKSILNVQGTDGFTGEELLLLGEFNFADLKKVIMANARNEEELMDACRHAVANVIDAQVEELTKLICAAGKIPIAIGGGHNNAYPLIKGAAKGLQKTGKIKNSSINVINLDAHADYRIMEGRHSGNAFRYARDEGYLHHYAVIGLHENYNSQSMMDDLYSNPLNQYCTYEDIFIRQRLNFTQAVAQALGFTEDGFAGIELDLDCLENTLSSAMTPCGITIQQARQYLSFVATDAKCAYLHICEGASEIDGTKSSTMGKLIGYLVTDFVKENKE